MKIDIKINNGYNTSKHKRRSVMRTEKQIEVFFYKKLPSREYLFLLMRRVPDRGGFWQPLTGGVEQGETLEVAIKREALEETGVTRLLRVTESVYDYEFTDEGRHHVEYIFGTEVPANTEIRLSHEHDDYQWVNKDEALRLLKWPGNKEGLQRLCKHLSL